jgi:hypothetical protein
LEGGQFTASCPAGARCRRRPPNPLLPWDYTTLLQVSPGIVRTLSKVCKVCVSRGVGWGAPIAALAMFMIRVGGPWEGRNRRREIGRVGTPNQSGKPILQITSAALKKNGVGDREQFAGPRCHSGRTPRKVPLAKPRDAGYCFLLHREPSRRWRHHP